MLAQCFENEMTDNKNWLNVPIKPCKQFVCNPVYAGFS